MSFPLLVHTDDLAIRSHCPYCAFQCGMLYGADAADGPVTIEGDPHFPVNNGQLCIKGWTANALLHHPERVTSPLVRGRDGCVQPASWDAALDAVAEAIRTTRERHGPDAVGLFGSGALTNEKAYLLGKFARVAVGSANIDYNGRYCMSSAAAAANRAFGLDRGLPFPVCDIEKAEVVFVVGGNPADTLPPIVQWFERQKRAGGRLIVSDPRKTATARLADLFLLVTPGSDLALANGLLYLAIEERLIDHAYVEARTTGFDAVRRIALTYHPAHVERLTGVAEASLRQAVRWLATARSAMILSGRGVEQQSKGVDSALAYINLALALGLPGKEFSGWGCLTGQGNGQGGREHGQKADQLPGYRLIEVDAHREAVAKVWGVDPASLPRKGKSAFELLDALGPEGGIRTLLVMGSNVAVASPDAGRIERRLRSLEHLAVCDSFLNETTSHAHVFLPVYQWAEEEGTMTNLEGRVIRRRRVARPPAHVRGDIDVLRELAERLGCGEKFPFHSPRDVFEEFRRATAGGPADYAGITYERIDREDGVFWPCPAEDHPGTPRLFQQRFGHADGRARFHPVEHRPAGEEPDPDYPFYFTTGRYKEHYNSGAQTRLVGQLAKIRPRPVVQIHPTAARRHRIVGGQIVTLESRRGRAEFQADVTSDVRPDTLFAPFHWGGREAANRLTNPALDPISRMPEFKLSAVRIANVQKAAVEAHALKKRLAIIGNGMAAGRLLDELLRRNAGLTFDIDVFGEEPHGLYNRILIGRIVEGGTQDEITLKPHSWYAERGIRFHAGVLVERLDTAEKRALAVDGEAYPYDVAVFATGSRPFVPPLDGLHTPDGHPKRGAFVYRTVDDGRRIREYARPASSAVVLGGGLLGLEAAKSLCDLGMHVTVVHPSAALANNQADETGGRFLRRAVERVGMFARTGEAVVGVRGVERVEGVLLKSGEALPADMLVLACGIRPRIDAAEASGVPVNKGIVVNDLLATSVPGVFAVGECAEHDGKIYGIVAPIWEQCVVLADILTGANPTARYRGSKLYTKLKVAGVEFASMGRIEPTSEADEVIQVIEDRRGIYRKLIVRDGKLAGALVIGETDSAPNLARWFDRGDPLPPNRLDLLCSSDLSPSAADPEICNCHHVTERTLVSAIGDGCASLAQLSSATRAGTGCGSCRGHLARLLLSHAPATNGAERNGMHSARH